MSKTDPPESWMDYMLRVVLPMVPGEGSPELIQYYAGLCKGDWVKQEREKVKYKKQLEQEVEEHERTVDQLRLQIERQKERVRREEARKREREAERERRDPTPVILTSEYDTPIPYSVRNRHIYVPGGTRLGKTTFLLNQILEDINNGHGVAVLDPKGGLINKICGLIPEHRINDCIYLDTESTPIPLDFMGHRRNEVETTIGELVFIITKDDPNLTAAGPMLKRAIRTLLSIPGTTFLDIRKFFTDKERQTEILDALALVNTELWKSWQPMPKEPEYRAIITRVDNFYWNPAFQVIFGSASARLKFDEAMNQRKIILANLAPIINPDNKLYGSLLVSKFVQAIFRRDPDIPEVQQIPFFLFVDEFEYFQTASFQTMFSVAGGLGMRLTVGNQIIGQLSLEIKEAVVGNAGTYVIFQLGALDYSLFKTVTHPYDPAWLTRLGEHHAMFKVGSAPPVFSRTKNSKPFDQRRADRVLYRIKEQTLSEYGKPSPSAQSSQKPTVDNYACNTQQKRQDKENGDQPIDYDNVEPTKD